MAQHIPIEAFKQKIFIKIKQAISKDFKRGWELLRGSLKYEYNNDRFYAVNENDEVFLTNRYIGKGFVWGSDKGSFEIHYNKKERRINNIYLVA